MKCRTKITGWFEATSNFLNTKDFQFPRMAGTKNCTRFQTIEFSLNGNGGL